MESDEKPIDSKILKDALSLSEDILQNMELSELPLSQIILKVSRLARLLNYPDVLKWMQYEHSGYDQSDESKLIAKWSGRVTVSENSSGEKVENVYGKSIPLLEAWTTASQTRLKATMGSDNYYERELLRNEITTSSAILLNIRNAIYQFVVRANHMLKYSDIANDIFARIRRRVDDSIGIVVPDATNRLSVMYSNLASENPEDWSNAVHACRRILKDLADSINPPKEGEKEREIEIDGVKKKISLDKNSYKNRIITYVNDNFDSERFKQVVGSQLEFLIDRLEALYEAACKGSHDIIASKEEADRYVIYTYLLIGDILSLKRD